jgi:hypothetical protein
MGVSKVFKMRTTLLVFLILSITLTGNDGENSIFVSQMDTNKAIYDLYDTQYKSLNTLEQIENKLQQYELSPKDLEHSKSK